MLKWSLSIAGGVPAISLFLAAAIPGYASAQQELVRRQHGEWTVQCRQANESQRICMAYTVLKGPNGAKAGILSAQPVAGQRLLSLSMESGYSLGAEVELRVDDNPGSRHGGCENLHCHILLEAESPLQPQLRRGNQLHVRGAGANYQASLIGYTAGQEAWTEMQKKARR